MWRRIIELGIADGMSARLSKRVRLVNSLAATMMLIAFPCPFIFLFFGLMVPAVVIAATVVSFVAVLWLNSRQRFFAARVLILPVVNLVVFYFCTLMGRDAGTYIVFLYAAVLPWVIFSERETVYAACASIISVGGFYYAFFHARVGAISWPAEMMQMSFVSSTLSTIVLLVITVRLFFNDSNRNEQFLNNINKELGETQNKLRETLKENEYVMSFAQVMYANSNSIDELCVAGLEKINNLLGNTYAAVLLYNKASDTLHLQRQWGSDPADARPYTIANGETLAGDAFMRQKTIRLSDLQPGYWQTSSALGSISPTELVILPMTFKAKVGVLELAFLRKLTDAEMAILQRLSVAFAANILPLEGNEENSRLVSELQRQKRELEANYKELQELRTKTALRTSEQYDAQQTLLKQILDKGKERERELALRIEELERQINSK